MSAPRKFDYAEAKRLRDKGLLYREIGESLGVTDSAVRLALNWRQRALVDMRVAEVQRSGVCRVCGVQCSFNPSQQVRGQEICKRCSSDLKITAVTDTSLKCHRCKEFKHDNDFAFSRAKKCEVRRGRHTNCRPCSTEAKREWRDGLKARGIPVR